MAFGPAGSSATKTGGFNRLAGKTHVPVKAGMN